jgi:hypothetical protein
MTQFKASYKSVAMIVGVEGKQVKYDLAKAQLFAANREIEIGGVWCPLFVLPVSKTTAVIGVQIRGLELEGSKTRIVETVAVEKKVAAPLADPFAEFADSLANDDPTDAALDAQLDAALGN